MRIVRGKSKICLKPQDTAQVSEILKYCNERKIAICPQGGNTGLVGGSVPVFDEVILNTSLMNKIEHISSVIVQPPAKRFFREVFPGKLGKFQVCRTQEISGKFLI